MTRHARPLNQPVATRGPSFSSPAWLLRGISSVPGELRLAACQLSFVAHGRGSAWDWQLAKIERETGTANFAGKLDSGSRALVFKHAVADVAVHFPWFYFSGGMIVRTPTQVCKLSFGKAARSSVDDDDLETVVSMRRVGKQWKRLLGVE